MNILGIFGEGAAADAGVGDDDIGYAGTADEIVRSGLQGCCITHIQRIAVNLSGKLLGQCLQQVRAAGAGCDLRALLQIMQGQRQSQAAGCAANDDAQRH